MKRILLFLAITAITSTATASDLFDGGISNERPLADAPVFMGQFLDCSNGQCFSAPAMASEPTTVEYSVVEPMTVEYSVVEPMTVTQRIWVTRRELRAMRRERRRALLRRVFLRRIFGRCR